MIRIFFVLAFLASVLPVELAYAASCTFESGFKTLHDLAPAKIGDCTDNATPQPNGDVQQHTTLGLLAWRKADNWTAFTNGSTTILNGPCGLQERANNNLFRWEVPEHDGCALLFQEGFFDVRGTSTWLEVKTSETFHLDGGVYLTSWEINSETGCDAFLEREQEESGFRFTDWIVHSPETGLRSGHGTTSLKMPPGTYDIKTIACGTFEIAVAR